MDELFDLTKNPILRFITGFVKGFLYDVVCYSIGWIVIRVLTAGKYPREYLQEGLRDSDSSESYPCLFGIIVIAIIAYQLF